MANPLSPGVRLSKDEMKSYGGITSHTKPFTPSPRSKQGNVSSGSVFPAGGNHDSPGGDSGSYRKPIAIKRRAGQGFGAVKRPANPQGNSPRGVQGGTRGNFGKV